MHQIPWAFKTTTKSLREICNLQYMFLVAKNRESLCDTIRAMASPVNYEFVDKVPEDYLCTICTNILTNSVLTDCCGQDFCEGCLKKWLQSWKTCAHCREVILECLNKCDKNIKRKDIRQHRNECLLEIVDCPFKEADCEVRLPQIDTKEHEASSMQSHLRLAMTTNKREKNELTRKHDELKRDFDNLLSVVSTELSSIHISPNDETPISGIRTILTSLTTMIQPDDIKAHCVHMSNKQGIFREPELEEYYDILQASSPALCIYPGFRIYLAFGKNRLLLVLEESDIHGYPETLSIEVQSTTGQSFSRSLSDLTCTATKQCDSGREFRFMVGTTLPFRVSNNFYANIKITDIS